MRIELTTLDIETILDALDFTARQTGLHWPYLPQALALHAKLNELSGMHSEPLKCTLCYK